MEIQALFDELYPLKGKEYEVHKKGLPASVRRSLYTLCEKFRDEQTDKTEIATRVRPEIEVDPWAETSE
jgi:hypothetical protein